MNPIGQSLLPIAAAPSAPGGSELACTQVPKGEGSFDSLLQQHSEEPVETSDPAVVTKGETEQIKTADDGDPSDVLISAGLVAMFGLPAIIPPQALVQTQPTEGVISDNAAEVGSKDTSTGSSEVPAPGFIQPETESTAAPFPAAPQKITPEMPREIATLPQSKDTPPPEPVTPVLQVATVRGIIPSAQNAMRIQAEANSKSAPAPFPTSPPVVSIEIPTATPDIPSEAGSEPAIPATTLENSPAILTEPIEQPIGAENKTTTPPLPAVRPDAEAPATPPQIAALPEVKNTSGMQAAKPGRVMSAPTLQRQPSQTAAIPAPVPAKGAQSTIPTLGESISFRNAPVLSTESGRQRSANDDSRNPERSPVTNPDFSAMPLASEPTTTSAAVSSSTPIQPADVAQVVNHTLAAVERLRLNGQERVDIALKLEGGQELTIQLRVANGQVTPIICTESEPLRLALEQNWSQFSQRSGDRELQITKPVFESPQTSSNMTDLNHQHDGRQRAFQEPENTFAHQYPLRRNPAPTVPQPTSTISTPPKGVSLYA